MTKFAELLGDKYKQSQKNIRTRTFEIGGHTFKVIIPLVSESDEIYKRVQTPPAELVEETFQKMTVSLREFKETEEIEITDTDILVQGKSMREAANNKIATEIRITEMIKLLVPENEENNLDDITYADIEAEFPLSVQLTLIEKISEVISPTYKESRGN